MKRYRTAVLAFAGAAALAAAAYAQQESGRFEGTSDPAQEVTPSTAPAVAPPYAEEGAGSSGVESAPEERRMPAEDRPLSPATPGAGDSGEGWRPGESSPGSDSSNPGRMPSPSERTTD